MPAKRLLAAVAGIAATAVMFGTTAASAGISVPVPDVKVAKQKAGPYKGNNVYGDGPGQRVKKQGNPGDVKTFFVKAENDGADTEEFKLQTSFNSSTYAKYRFFRGDDEITDEMRPGPYEFELEPGKQVRVRIRFKLKQNAVENFYQEDTVLQDSTGTVYDVVGYGVRV